jgi:hypothetical protein
VNRRELLERILRHLGGRAEQIDLGERPRRPLDLAHLGVHAGVALGDLDDLLDLVRLG